MVLKHHFLVLLFFKKKVRSQRDKGEIITSVNTATTIEIAMNEEYNEPIIEGVNDVKIDYTPLYQCLHIHEVLGKISELKDKFDENRNVRFFYP